MMLSSFEQCNECRKCRQDTNKKQLSFMHRAILTAFLLCQMSWTSPLPHSNSRDNMLVIKNSRSPLHEGQIHTRSRRKSPTIPIQNGRRLQIFKNSDINGKSKIGNFYDTSHVKLHKMGITNKFMNFLQNFGYYQKPDPRKSGFLLETEAQMRKISQSVLKFQRFYGLNETGVYDNETKTWAEKPRCGMADFGPSDNARRKRRWTHQGTSWMKNKLTWRVVNDNDDGLTRDQVDDVLYRAFKKWSDVTNLDFIHIDSALNLSTRHSLTQSLERCSRTSFL